MCGCQSIIRMLDLQLRRIVEPKRHKKCQSAIKLIGITLSRYYFRKNNSDISCATEEQNHHMRIMSNIQECSL